MKSKVSICLLIIAATLGSCGHNTKSDESDDATVKAHTPVTVTNISKEDIASAVALNASSAFLKKSSLKSPVAGYVKEVSVKLGDVVRSGQLIFTMQTKEAAAYHNLNISDTTLKYSGIIHVKANADGIVQSIYHVAGDYAQDGDSLCSIAEQSSFVFLLEVPYEMHQYVKPNEHCIINLPDGRKIDGVIGSKLSNMDMTSQTERFFVKPTSSDNIPENLLASISITIAKKEKTITLPKDAVLSNETQTEYWVMKLQNDTTAVKIPVHVGIRSEDKIEITNPVFTDQDRFVLTGGYGLPDKASVTITK